MPRPIAQLLLWIITSIILTGCAGRGTVGALRAVSLSEEPVSLAFHPSIACYDHDPAQGTSFWLADAPFEKIVNGEVTAGQIVHVELLWIPKPGTTPANPAATNASIRWIVISDGELGVYSGAGYATPGGKLGGRSAGLSVHHASLTLEWSTDGFRDLLTPAELRGGFSAPLDARMVRRTRMTVSQFVTDAIGLGMFVQLPPSLGRLGSCG